MDLPESAQSFDAGDSDKFQERKAREALRAALSSIELTPEQTRDDLAPKSVNNQASTDDHYLRDVPPHHN